MSESHMSEHKDIRQTLLSALDKSFANGFELAKQRAINFLTERADWLRKEYLNGGNFEYLRAKEEDCRYTAKVIAEMQPPPELIENIAPKAANS